MKKKEENVSLGQFTFITMYHFNKYSIKFCVFRMRITNTRYDIYDRTI